MTTLVLFLPLFGALYYLYSTSEKPPVAELQQETVAPLSVDLQEVSTTAYSAFVVSLNTEKILYQKQPDKLLPLASITKLITTKVAEDQTESNQVSVSKMIDPTYGDAKLTQGQQWDKGDLIAYTLITSSNDGAHSLSTGTQATSFVDSMNKLASTIGLTSTRFYNETGLDNDEAGIPGSKGTAKDVSKLLSYLVKNDIELYEKTKHDTALISSPTGVTLAENTNEVTNQIVGLLVSKTGYTDIAGGNLAIVADMGLNEPTAFVVLHSSKEARFDDVLKLQQEYFTQVAEKMR
jgi:D-alanyl-D-alanine carboxypeptidase